MWGDDQRLFERKWGDVRSDTSTARVLLAWKPLIEYNRDSSKLATNKYVNLK